MPPQKFCGGMMCLSDEIGPDTTLCGGRLNSGELTGLDAFQKPGHIPAQISHGLQALLVLGDFFRSGTVDHIPVGGGYHRHLVDGKVFVDLIQGGSGSGPAGTGDGSSGLLRQTVASGVEQPIHKID